MLTASRRRRLPVMRRAAALAALVVVVVAAALAADGPSQTTPFEYGVAAGEIGSSRALLWTRAPRLGQLGLELRSGSFGISKTATARTATDRTVTVDVSGLRPRTRFRYRFRQGGAVSAWGTFTTAPRPATSAQVRFAITGDADATPGPDGKPAFNRFQVYGRMRQEANDFNVNLGDTIYSDSEVGGAAPAISVAGKWEKYRRGLAPSLPLQALRGSAGLYSHWDDHEFINDFSRAESGSEVFRAGLKAFRDYSPVTYSGRLGLYRSFRWGRNLELFFLDERTFRSAKADGACAGDLAPTAPQAVRTAFAGLAPPLLNPVPPACLAALADPKRTMLGSRQYAAFTEAIGASTATWKVVVNEVPIQQFYVFPFDRWEGYAAEREQLLRFLQANVKNVVFLTTDTHANLVNEVRYRTLGGPPESSGIWEAVTGPVATNTFAKEVDSALGTAGAGTAVGALFFKPPPPQGMGMRCAALDVYSYAQVTVTKRTLRIAPKDASGNPVREATGAACAPLVLTAR